MRLTAELLSARVTPTLLTSCRSAKKPSRVTVDWTWPTSASSSRRLPAACLRMVWAFPGRQLIKDPLNAAGVLHWPAWGGLSSLA